MTMHTDCPQLSARTATLLGIMPGLGSWYAGKPVQAATWFLSVAAAEASVLFFAFPEGGLTGFGAGAVVFLQAVALLVWGFSVQAGRRHARAANRARGGS
jgi:hypothetical protein